MKFGNTPHAEIQMGAVDAESTLTNREGLKHMIKNVNNTYRKTTVHLDGNHFESCIFEDCQLEYGGTDKVGLVSCEFTNCVWSFVGPAANTIQFMGALYHGLGNDGRGLIEKTFDQIRSGVREED